MLEPNANHLYADLLTPPPGYRLEKGIGLTYSVDLRALLLSPLAFARLSLDAAATEETRSDGPREPLQLLEALRRASKRLAVFCQSGRIQVPGSHTELFTFLESMLQEVRLERGSFHPKLWLLHFRAEDEAPRFRLVCTSRNLTFDRAWDMVVTMDGRLSDEPQPENADLRKLLNFLADRAESVARAELVRDFAGIISFVDFAPAEPFDSFTLRCQGVPGTKPLSSTVPTASRSLIISPFITEDGLKLTRRGSDTVIGRKDELDKLHSVAPDALQEQDVRVLSDGVVAGDEDGVSSGDLHAKLYVYKQGSKNIWRLGSANATTSGLRGRNVEVLAELSSTNDATGIDRLLTTSDEDSDNILLGDILARYRAPTELESDEAEGNLQERLDGLRRKFTSLDMTVVAEPVDNDLWTVELRIDGGVDLPAGMTAKIWLISLNADLDALHFRDRVPGIPEKNSYGRRNTSALTRFIGIELTAEDGDDEISSSFVRAAATEGFPEDRENMVLRNLISSRARFLAYLRFLLSDDTSRWDNLLSQIEAAKSRGANAGQTSRRAPVPLMEALVSRCVDKPSRLREIHTLVQSLRDTPDGHEIVPDDFIEHVFLPVLDALDSSLAREYRDA